MIDKKIEEAARFDDKEYYDRLSDNDRCFFEYGFRRGYNRALKDLWHPAEEEPRKDVSIMVETHNDKNMFYYAWNRWQDNFYPSWTDAVLCSRVSRWLYIDDLFPKEGGNHD